MFYSVAEYQVPCLIELTIKVEVAAEPLQHQKLILATATTKLAKMSSVGYSCPYVALLYSDHPTRVWKFSLELAWTTPVPEQDTPGAAALHTSPHILETIF